MSRNYNLHSRQSACIAPLERNDFRHQWHRQFRTASRFRSRRESQGRCAQTGRSGRRPLSQPSTRQPRSWTSANLCTCTAHSQPSAQPRILKCHRRSSPDKLPLSYAGGARAAITWREHTTLSRWRRRILGGLRLGAVIGDSGGRRRGASQDGFDGEGLPGMHLVAHIVARVLHHGRRVEDGAHPVPAELLDYREPAHVPPGSAAGSADKRHPLSAQDINLPKSPLRKRRLLPDRRGYICARQCQQHRQQMQCTHYMCAGGLRGCSLALLG